MNSISNLMNTPEFVQNTEPQNCALLSHTDCSLCGQTMQEGPHGIASVPVSCKDIRSGSRYHYIFYHSVCQSCFETIDFELDAVPIDNVPEWSLLGKFLYERNGRDPLLSAAINDPDAILDMMRYNHSRFDTWEDFDIGAIGMYDAYAYNDQN